MKHEIEGSDLRACIDKAYDAGYNECIRKTCEYLKYWAVEFINDTTDVLDVRGLIKHYKEKIKDED